jgi:hypothetical protein
MNRHQEREVEERDDNQVDQSDRNGWGGDSGRERAEINVRESDTRVYRLWGDVG